ncbi:MAG: helix-turn-helix domain-containing protein [Flavobacteriaceae bacterium]|nr:helix-turn-helix domain-containing protein [Flavobacteriaceae bacterium]
MDIKLNNKPKKREDFLKEVVNPMINRRKELGLTQEDVNHKLGVADFLVAKWERGIRSPTAFNFLCWAEVLKGRIVFISDDDYKSPKDMIEEVSNDNSPE